MLNHKAPQHIGLISATYFKNSTIYPPNSMVLLFNSQRSWWPVKSLVCKSYSKETIRQDLARVRHAHLPNFICSWTPYIAICQVTEDIKSLQISDTSSRSNSIKVDYEIYKNVDKISDHLRYHFVQRMIKNMT